VTAVSSQAEGKTVAISGEVSCNLIDEVTLYTGGVAGMTKKKYLLESSSAMTKSL
jgi:hypothetical protein